MEILLFKATNLQEIPNSHPEPTFVHIDFPCTITLNHVLSPSSLLRLKIFIVYPLSKVIEFLLV